MGENIGFSESITPASLRKDNESFQAQKSIRAWYEAKADGALTGIISCSDARVSTTTAFNTPKIVSIRTVAAGNVRNSHDPMSWAFGHKGAGTFVVLDHFDGEEFQFGQSPNGCGGCDARGMMTEDTMKSTSSTEVYNALDYVRNYVDHRDMVMQALMTASRLTRYTNAPILAAAIDHRTYKIYPLAVMSGDNFQSPFRLADLIDYDPKCLYGIGIPTLDLSWTPGPFHALIRANQDVAVQLSADPRFIASQRVQNPLAVVISTDIRPAGIRYSRTFGKPNTGFMVRLPIIKQDGEIRLDSSEIDVTLAQAGYALSHAASASLGASFFDTSTVLVETPSMKLTQAVIDRLKITQAYKDWIKNKKGQLIGAQVNNAKVTDIESFSK